MISGKAYLSTKRTCFALLGATLLSVVVSSATIAQAQKPSPLDSLTAESVIGDAVSLSNQDYPEIDKAIQRFRNGDAEGTLEFLKSAVLKYPKLPPSQVIYARMNLLMRNAQAVRVALFWLERAVTEVPDDPEAYLILADQAFSSSRTTDAQALFEFAAPLVEKFDANTKRKQKFNIRILAGRAAIAQRRAHWEVANQWLLNWIEADPESAVAHQRLGTTLFNLEKEQEALKEFTKARELDDKGIVAHPYVSIGLLFTQAGENDKARTAFEHAYDKDNADEKVVQAYVNWLIAQDELEQAQTVMKALRKQKPALESALMLDGILDVMQGKHDEAITTMTEILALDPSNSRATDLLALLLIDKDDVASQEKALRYAQVNAQRFPDNTPVNITQAWVLFRLGRKNEAQQFLSKVQQNKLSSDAYYLLSRMMVESGKKDQAIKAMDQLLKKQGGLFIFRREAEKFLAGIKAE